MKDNKKAPISMCIIVKNEPLLEKCILSFKDYVEEIVVVDTGSTDGITQEIAKKYANIFEVYTDCNDPDTGLIEDFSQARQRSFDLATQKWVGWCDADDILTGTENLKDLTEVFNNKQNLDSISYLFPYEYSYDANGRCTLRHYRERLFYNKNYYKWINPVHEVAIPIDNCNVAMIESEEIVYKHQRQYSNKIPEQGRNLRILKKYFEKVGETDARQLYYLGLECCNSGLLNESIQYLVRYIEISGWDDERVMACLKLVDIFQMSGKYDEALKWGFKAIEINEHWAEGYFALGKIFYFLALKGGANEHRNWERCVHHMQRGLSLPPTKTLLFINPLERLCEIHKYLNVAFNKLGRVHEALESVKTGLITQSDEPHLLNNKKLYEIFLARQEIVNSLNKLKDIGELDQQNISDISAIINKTPFNIIEKTYDPIDCMPLFSGVSCGVFDINTEKVISTTPFSKLDIIFYVGNGVEEWTPETVKHTGIGGSELMVIELSKRLVKLGHRVRVYSSCGQTNIYDGVEYHPTELYNNLQCDILIVSRYADKIDNQYHIQARLKLLYVHDIFAISANSELMLKYDRILALTSWHKNNLINHHVIHPNQIIVTRNGIDSNRFKKDIKRNRFKCVNSSSPDRSWPVLLDIWPEIKKQVPEAELHLYYGFKNWEFLAQADSLQMDLINRIKSQIKNLEPLGVVYHGRVNHQQLAEEFLSAGVWVYPTWFSETSCISAMEAQAAGLRMVTSQIAALNETIANRGILIPGEWTSSEYQTIFINETVATMLKEDNSDRIVLQNYAQSNFELDLLANDWNNMLYQLLEEVKDHPIVSYISTTS